MPSPRRIAIIALFIALPLIPLIGGLASPGGFREVALLGLVAVAGIAFVVLLAGPVDGSGQVALPRSLGEITLGVLRTFGIATLIGLALTVVVLWLRGDGTLPRNRIIWAQYISVGFFAGAVGFSELIARYRDDPMRLFGMRPALAYITINVVAGVIALALVQQFKVVDPTTANHTVIEALLAAFGAIAFFRTSLFTTRVGDTDIGIGPATLLKTFLEGTDRMVNRSQATDRAHSVQRCMSKVDFAKAKATLTALCLGLVEDVSPDDQKLLAEQIAKLEADTTINAEAKATILGVYLLRQVGGTVLHKAVDTLGVCIQTGPSPLLEPVEPV